jgi:anti-sigma B factor antagonist
MKLRVSEVRGWSVVALEGEIDLESSPELRDALLERVRAGPVLVDLSAVAYIDSSGIASLIEALQAARTRGTHFGLSSPSEPALRVLRLARLETVFPIHASVDEGLGDDAG